MKVQRKVMPSEQFYVREESDSYYIAVDAICRTLALDKREYEPVQEWVDVTAECEHIHDDIPIVHDGYVRFTGNMRSGGYRLRKVRAQYTPESPYEWAFIVERKQ